MTGTFGSKAMEQLEARQLLAAEIDIIDSVAPDDDNAVDFGSVDVSDTSVVQTFKISNTGTTTLQITNFQIGGSEAGDFTAVVLTPGGSLVNPPDFNVAAGSFRTVVAAFIPSAEGARVGNITFATNDATGSEDAITLDLTGTGTAANGPEILVTDSYVLPQDRTIYLGSVLAGETSATETFSLKNVGDQPLTVANFGVNGANAADFVVTVKDASDNPVADGNFTIAAGETFTIDVSAIPSAAGMRVASLDFNTDDADDGEGTVSLAVSVKGLSNPPEAPSGFAAATISDTRIGLTWTDNADNETSHKVWRAEKANGPWTLVRTTNANGERATMTGLTGFKTYFFRIASNNVFGNSSYVYTSGTTAPKADAYGVVNNTPGTATDLGTLTSPRVFRNYVGSGDIRDYYKVKLAHRGLIRLALTEMGAPLTVGVYRQETDGTMIRLASKTRSAPFVARAEELAAGTYFVRLTSGSSTNYRMEITPDYAGSSRGTALNLGSISGTKTARDCVGVGDSSDFYRISVGSRKKIQFRLTNLSIDADMELLDEKGRQILLADLEGKASETLTRTLDAGRYFVHVYRYEATTNTGYTLTARPV